MRAAVRTLVTLCVVALAVFAGYQLWQYYMLTPWTRDARVRADVVVIAPDVSGWVRELKARDNQQVKAGDLLMSIDRERFQAAFDQASAVTETRSQQLRLREREAARRTALGPEAISAELRKTPRSMRPSPAVSCMRPRHNCRSPKSTWRAVKCGRRAAGISPTCAWPRATM